MTPVRITDDPAVAARALADGHLAALPTETVYGLGARADLPRAVARVYAAKGRPADHPVIVHVVDATALRAWAVDLPAYAQVLAERLWPGPMTLVVPRSDRAGDFVTGGQDTVGVRVPSHPVMRAVLGELGGLTGDPAVGVAAPSANRFGRVSPTTVDHVVSEFADALGDDDVALDGGPSTAGIESTIVDCTGVAPGILRPGSVTRAQVEAVTGLRVQAPSAVRAPGTLSRHYAPRAKVRIVGPGDVVEEYDDAMAGAAGVGTVGVLAMVDVRTPAGAVRLSAPGTAEEYARVLYAALREADAMELTTVLAVLPPAVGVGAAVADRLLRAARA